jgi:hypothetical protein
MNVEEVDENHSRAVNSIKAGMITRAVFLKPKMAEIETRLGLVGMPYI